MLEDIPKQITMVLEANRALVRKQDWYNLNPDYFEEVLKRSFQTTLMGAWIKLYKKARQRRDFADFVFRATTNEVYYSEARKVPQHWDKERALLQKALKALQEFKSLIKKNEDVEKQLAFEFSMSVVGTLSMDEDKLTDNYTDRFDISLDNNILKDLEESVKYLIKARLGKSPHRSRKAGDSGLIPFYTNCLCELTSKNFTRPCHESIAEVAYLLLLPDKDITKHQVRTNYNNLQQRLSSTKVKDSA